jgi:hypothetical protein
MVEQLTLNQRVGGSSPPRFTNFPTKSRFCEKAGRRSASLFYACCTLCVHLCTAHRWVTDKPKSGVGPGAFDKGLARSCNPWNPFWRSLSKQRRACAIRGTVVRAMNYAKLIKKKLRPCPLAGFADSVKVVEPGAVHPTPRTAGVGVGQLRQRSEIPEQASPLAVQSQQTRSKDCSAHGPEDGRSLTFQMDRKER